MMIRFKDIVMILEGVKKIKDIGVFRSSYRKEIGVFRSFYRKELGVFRSFFSLVRLYLGQFYIVFILRLVYQGIYIKFSLLVYLY